MFHAERLPHTFTEVVGTLAYGKLEGVLAVGNGINFAFLKAEDVRTVLSVGRQTPND